MNQALRNASETDRARALAWMAENCFGDPTDSDGGASARIEGGCEACADALAALLGEVRDEDRGASTPSSSSPSSRVEIGDSPEVAAEQHLQSRATRSASIADVIKRVPRPEGVPPEAHAIRVMVAHFDDLGSEPCDGCGYSLNEIRDYVNELLAGRELATAVEEYFATRVVWSYVADKCESARAAMSAEAKARLFPAGFASVRSTGPAHVCNRVLTDEDAQVIAQLADVDAATRGWDDAIRAAQLIAEEDLCWGTAARIRALASPFTRDAKEKKT